MVEESEKIVAVMQTIEETMKTQEEKIQQTKSIFDQLNNNIQLVTSTEADMQANVTIMNSSKDDMSGIISSLELSASGNLASSENAANMTGQMMEEIRGLSDLTGTLQELSDNLKNTLESFLT